MRARVVSFDAARGLGLLETDEGESLSFHCVEIADQSRSITVGARVSASRSVGRLGYDEAVGVEASSD
ncbi:MAG: hypothetical protein ACRDV0_10240 [Acidimicrobiales bacterium]